MAHVGPSMDLSTSLLDYWKERLSRHYYDMYRDRALVKLPEDLRTYQRVIEWSQPDCIVELGTYGGGSAVWLYDQLRCLTRHASPLIVTVDHNAPAAFKDEEGDIVFVQGDLASEQVRKRVAELASGRRTMVIDDSEHTYPVTTASLNGYADLVTSGCYFVVEDGVVDVPELGPWPNTGVQAAIDDFLATEQGSRFSRNDYAFYIVTMHFGGWLKAER